MPPRSPRVIYERYKKLHTEEMRLYQIATGRLGRRIAWGDCGPAMREAGLIEEYKAIREKKEALVYGHFYFSDFGDDETMDVLEWAVKVLDPEE